MVITNAPKNINDARRMANCYAKAQQIIKEGYTFSKDKDTDVIAVCKPGRLAASYWIDEDGCDCPDFLKHAGYCKHTLANDILAEEAAGLEAQCAEYDARVAIEW